MFLSTGRHATRELLTSVVLSYQKIANTSQQCVEEVHLVVQQRFRSLMVSGDSINSAPEQVTDEDDHPQGDAPPECVERLGAGPDVESYVQLWKVRPLGSGTVMVSGSIKLSKRRHLWEFASKCFHPAVLTTTLGSQSMPTKSLKVVFDCFHPRLFNIGP